MFLCEGQSVCHKGYIYAHNGYMYILSEFAISLNRFCERKKSEARWSSEAELGVLRRRAGLQARLSRSRRRRGGDSEG